MRAANKADAEKLVKILLKENNAKDGMVTNFNGVLPMPDALRIDAGSFSGEKGKEMERLYADNKEKYGYRHWYDFANAVWGSKWDNLNAIENDGTITFDSAWCIPDGVYAEISKTIPIIVAYADEDIGRNCGVLLYEDSVSTDIPITGTDTQIANAVWEYYSEDDDIADDYSDKTMQELDALFN